MLYRMLKKIKATKGLDDAMRGKIDVFYALGKLSDAEYRELLDLPEEETEGSADDAGSDAGADDTNAAESSQGS